MWSINQIEYNNKERVTYKKGHYVYGLLCVYNIMQGPYAWHNNGALIFSFIVSDVFAFRLFVYAILLPQLSAH